MPKRKMVIQEGYILGKYPYLCFGEGPPLVVLRGIMPSNENSKGIARWAELRMLKPYAQHFTVYSISRRPELPSGTTIADLAEDYAEAIQSEFSCPVDILGFSTSGTIALQLAVDHSVLLRRLIVAGTAFKLGQIGKEVQRKYAESLIKGRYREASKSLAPILAKSKIGQCMMGTTMWITEPLGRAEQYTDMIVTLAAEDTFDIGDRLKEIAVPTLIIGGEYDFVYPLELVVQTAKQIPQSQLIIYPKCLHNHIFTHKRFIPDTNVFLLKNDLKG
ncbi:alpha/beta fold hydrolase [Shimazuella kribbensis]|uniref:alpha/beta fold hydrolase n=1 Tax=Shimazuella kribbensis TaxID=139808 RepID=UPI000420F4A3|nr:alpha/beta hydrolase [Shimazuella kribbensis]